MKNRNEMKTATNENKNGNQKLRNRIMIIFLIPDAAHSPLWENPEKTCEVLRQIKEKHTNE